jgi:hypothetical protein
VPHARARGVDRNEQAVLSCQSDDVPSIKQTGPLADETYGYKILRKCCLNHAGSLNAIYSLVNGICIGRGRAMREVVRVSCAT